MPSLVGSEMCIRDRLGMDHRLSWFSMSAPLVLFLVYVAISTVITARSGGHLSSDAILSVRKVSYYLIAFPAFVWLHRKKDVRSYLSAIFSGLTVFNLFYIYLTVSHSSATQYFYTRGASGPLSVPNGEWFVFFLPLGILLISEYRGFTRLCSAIAVSIFLVVLIIGQNRTGWVSVATGLVFLGYEMRRHRLLKLPVVILGLSSVIAVSGLIWIFLPLERSVDTADLARRWNELFEQNLSSEKAFAGREGMVLTAFVKIAEKPLFGNGPGTFVSVPWISGRGRWDINSVDMVHVTLLLYFGIVGYFLFAKFFFKFVKAGWRLANYRDRETRLIGIWQRSATPAYFFFSLTTDWYLLSKLVVLIAVLAAVMEFLLRFSHSENKIA